MLSAGSTLDALKTFPKHATARETKAKHLEAFKRRWRFKPLEKHRKSFEILLKVAEITTP